MDTIKIQIDTNAEQASKSFEDLSKSFNDTDKQAIDLRKQIKGLKDDLYKLTPGTEEYGRVLEELGGKMDQLSDTQQELRVATGGLDAVFQSSTQAISSLAGGFTAAMGVCALFGKENESLQKTFVKLQAAMAIVNGLKGFASFPKTAKRAIISISSFINQTKLSTQAVRENTMAVNGEKVALEGLTQSEIKATASTNGFTNAIRTMGAVIKSNPFGALLTFFTALITVISIAVSKAQEESEELQKYKDIINGTNTAMKSYVDTNKELDAQHQKNINQYKAMGASIETIRKISLEYYKAELAKAEAIKNTNQQIIDSQKIGQPTTKRITEAYKACAEATERVNELKAAIDELTATDIPTWAANMNEAISGFVRETQRNINKGLLTKGAGLSQIIQKYKDDIDRLSKIESDYILGNAGDREASIRAVFAAQELGIDNGIDGLRAQKSKLEQVLKGYVEELENFNDNAMKTASDKLAAAAKNSQDELETLLKELKKEWLKAVESFNDIVNANSLLGDAIGDSNANARMYEGVSNIALQFDKLMDDMLKAAKKNKKLLQPELTAFAEMILTYTNRMDELFTQNNLDYADWPFPIKTMAMQLDGLADIFIKENNIMLEQLRLGTLKADEYNNWLVERTNEFNATRAKTMENATQLIEDELANMNVSDAQKEEYRKQWMELFNFSGELLPPDEAKKITDGLWNALKQGLDKGEAELNNMIKKMQTDVDLAANAWIRGKGDFGIISTILFGTDESPTKVYEQAQKQAQDIYAGLYQQYNQELEMAQRSAEIAKALYGEKSEAYQQYADEILRIQGLLDQAQIDYEAKQVENAENYADKIKEAAMGTLDAVSGLTGAIASYYAEQAEQAKETYGENSEEYKKYLKKEGDMKIAQVWTDFASGVMSAWATSEQLGPIAGPILAGIQTAALLATAIASTQQIKRQTRATANGDGNANVSGLTDRVIMAEAQNTDQTAQLNADYNQGAQRVFVTVDDINNGQDANRTAVTNNRF